MVEILARVNLKLLLFLLLSVLAGAQLSAVAAEKQENIGLILLDQDINGYVTQKFQILNSTAPDITLDNVLANEYTGQNDWIKITENAYFKNREHSIHWLKGKIANTSDRPTEFILELDFPHINSVEFYLVANNNNQWETIHAKTVSDYERIQLRDIPYRNYLLRYAMPAHSNYDIYIKVKSSIVFVMPIGIWDEQTLLNNMQEFSIFNGIFLGCMLGMILYNLFLFASTRDEGFGWYVLFLLFSTAFLFVERGIGAYYLPSYNPEWVFRFTIADAFLVVGLAAHFASVYLDLKNRYPKYNRALMTGVYLNYVLAAVFLIYPQLWMIFMVVSFVIIMGGSAFFTGLMLWSKGLVIAKYYSLAWFAVILGGIVHAFVGLGLIDANVITKNSMQVAYMLEAVLFSFGLAYRIKTLAEEKNQAREEALVVHARATKEKLISEGKTKARTQFFASMSHEFRTPLTAILGYSDMASNQSLSDSKRLEYVKTISHSAQHMLQLINDVLDLSKIEAQKLEVEQIETQLIPLCEEVKNVLWILADKKGIEFKLDYQFPLPESIVTDPTRIKQVLVNLCSNAIKFTDKGSVTIAVSCEQEPLQVKFEVIDTGIGLKEEQLSRLFGAFEQADKSTSRNYGGTGLGLHLSKLIAQSLGGDIVVSSVYGQGSNFTFTSKAQFTSMAESNDSAYWIRDDSFLQNKNDQPLMTASSAETEPQQTNLETLKPKPQNTLKVLVADDNSVNLKLLSARLEKMSTQVINASDGVEALAKIWLEQPDLVFIDLEMPHMEGLTVVELCRAKNLTTPIYALTGDVSEGIEERCSLAGCTGHLPKPYDMKVIQSVVTDLKNTISQRHSNTA